MIGFGLHLSAAWSVRLWTALEETDQHFFMDAMMVVAVDLSDIVVILVAAHLTL